MATDLQDTALLAKISGGDRIAIEAKYHLSCLIELRNRHRSKKTRQFQESSESRNEDQKNEARAFIELTSSIENSVEYGIFNFKLVDLRKLHEKRLQDLGIRKEINSRFKEKILQYFPQAQEQSDGKHIVLIFPEGMQLMLKEAMNCDHERDAAILAKAAKIVRNEILQRTGFHFDASFPASCQEQSVPSTLKILVAMLLNGPDVKQQDSTGMSDHFSDHPQLQEERSGSRKISSFNEI